MRLMFLLNDKMNVFCINSGILKNARPLPPKFFDDIKTEQEDDETPKKKVKLEVDSENNEVSMEEGEAGAADESKDHELPEGFFDDPVLDAKVTFPFCVVFVSIKNYILHIYKNE